MKSPFATARFEHEGTHLYYLPTDLLKPLEEERPVYLVGGRGTGKTTLLKALNWEERLKNQSLMKQLPRDPFENRYIGLYMKLPRLQLGDISEWLALCAARGPLKASVMALYLDLSWLELAARAMNGLLAENILKWQPKDEHDQMELLLARFPDFRRYLPSRGPHTIASIGDAFVALRRRLVTRSHGRSHKYEEFLDELPLCAAGELGRTVSRYFVSLCNTGTRRANGWYFKFCIDEGESLDDFQQIVVNTITRHAESPALPVVSFVRMPDDPTTTLDPSLRLQRADRDLLRLDAISDTQFQQLVEGIATVRTRTLLKDPTVSFRTAEVLGKLDINALLDAMIRESTNRDAKALLKRAKALQRHPFFLQRQEVTATHSTRRGKLSRPPPIYETYLIERLGIDLPSPDVPLWERRAQESAEIRKRMVAAYLSLCREFRFRVRFASAEMLLQMSDRCVRDFLLQMKNVFHRSKRTLGDFLAHQVDMATQQKALRAASEDKRDRLPDEVRKGPTETERIVTGLARITAHIQASSPADQHLRSSERGRFVLRIERAISDDGRRVLDFINEASEAGYLRVVRAEPSEWVFQVHASLAAAFEFSYRGAQYSTFCSLDDISTLASSRDTRSLDAAVKRIAGKLAGREPDQPEEPEMPLFDMMQD